MKLGLGLSQSTGGGALAPSGPYASLLALFGADEPGEVWPVHEDYLFTDTACTTPVSAVGDEVQGWLGLKYGVKFTQSTAARMPKYGRQPVGGWTQHCLQSGDLSNAAWTKTNATATSGQSDPDGGSNAWLVTTTTGGSISNVSQTIARGNGDHVWSIIVKAGTVSRFLIGHYKTSGFSDNIIDLGTQTWVLNDTGVTKSVTDLGDGWIEITLTYSGAFNTPAHYFGPISSSGSTINSTTTGGTVYVYQPIRARGTTRPTYQQRGEVYEGPSSGSSVAALYFDGVSDSMVSSSVDFTSTDKITVWLVWDKRAKISDFGALVELSSNPPANNGTFFVTENGNSGSESVYLGMRGTTAFEKRLTQETGPISRNFISASFDISAGASAITANVSDEYGDYSALTGAVGTSPGSGNFGSYPIYIGTLGGTGTFDANGSFAGALVVLGRAPTGSEFADTVATLGGLV